MNDIASHSIPNCLWARISYKYFYERNRHRFASWPSTYIHSIFLTAIYLLSKMIVYISFSSFAKSMRLPKMLEYVYIFLVYFCVFLFIGCMNGASEAREGEQKSQRRIRNHLVFHIWNSPKVAKTHSTEENLFIVLTLLMYRFKLRSFAGTKRRTSHT